MTTFDGDTPAGETVDVIDESGVDETNVDPVTEVADEAPADAEAHCRSRLLK